MKLYKTKHKYNSSVSVLTKDKDIQLNGLVSIYENYIKISLSVNLDYKTCECSSEDFKLIKYITKRYKILTSESGWCTKSQIWYDWKIEKHKDFE